MRASVVKKKVKFESCRTHLLVHMLRHPKGRQMRKDEKIVGSDDVSPIYHGPRLENLQRDGGWSGRSGRRVGA